MASYELGTILIKEAHNGHSAGDLIEVFFDTTTETFSVEQNDVTVTTLPGIIIFIGWLGNYTTYSTRTTTGFSYQNAEGNLVSFSYQNEYPYFFPQVTEVVDTGINDVRISVQSVIDASAAGTADGAVTVTATGTNSPFSYSKNNTTFQNSGLFSGLYAGAYTFWVRDALGYKAQISTFVNVETPESNDVKYRGTYADTENVKHRLDIIEPGFSGTINTLQMAANPVVINHRSEGSQPGIDNVSIATEATIRIICNTVGEYHELATSGDHAYLVKYYRDTSEAKDGSSYELRFQGYPVPETYSEDFGITPYYVTFSASDKLPDLDNLEYTPGFFASGSIPTLAGFSLIQDNLIPEIDILIKCLRKTRLTQGFRIALNIWEESMTTTNSSPLHQAYEDEKNYFRAVDDIDSCGEVINKILKPYQAILFSWQGYWYIINAEEFKNSSISYNEFNSSGTYVTNGTFTPRITFKANNSTDFYRYIGAQSLSFTSTYRTINIRALAEKNENGILPDFNRPISTVVLSLDDPFNLGGNAITGFRGYELVIGNELYQRTYNRDDIQGWRIVMIDEQISNTYIRASDTISYTSQDTFTLSWKVRPDFFIGGLYFGIDPGEPASYLVMKWQLKIGTKYLQVDGTWTTTETINQFFIEKDEVGTFIDFDINASLPDGVTTETSETYELKVYPISAWEFDEEYADRTAMISGMQTEANDSNYRDGSRRIVRYNDTGNYYYYLYYELRVDEDAANDGIYQIKGAGDRYWTLEGTWYELVQSGASIFTGRTSTVFTAFKFDTQPAGEEAPDEFNLPSTTSTGNNIDLEIELYHFDLPGTITNDENLYTNFTKRSTGAPTTVWTRNGGVALKTRQEHLKDSLQETLGKNRYKLNASFLTDEEVSILNTLYHSTDDGRIFILNGLQIDTETNEHSGEVIEIDNDNITAAGEFSNDFDIDNEYT